MTPSGHASPTNMRSREAPEPAAHPASEPSLGQPEDGAALGTTTAPSVVSGGLWTLLNRALPQAQLLALSIIAARYLGPDDMGRQSYIAFVALALVQAATAGFPGALSRFIGELLGAPRGGQGVALYPPPRPPEGPPAGVGFPAPAPPP